MTKLSSGDGRWHVEPTELPTLNFKQFRPHLRFNAANRYSNYGDSVHHISIDTFGPNNKKADEMGHIEWHKDTGEILGVETGSKYRRMGVANTLFHEAKRIAREQGLTEPMHSADRSDMGDAWAKSVGGNLPKRLTASDFPTL